jgi:hypothetical protein
LWKLDLDIETQNRIKVKMCYASIMVSEGALLSSMSRRRGLELNVNCISKLSYGVFSQQTEVSVHESLDSVDVPLRRIGGWEILRSPANDLLVGRHDPNVADVGMIVVVPPSRWFMGNDKGQICLLGLHFWL